MGQRTAQARDFWEDELKYLQAVNPKTATYNHDPGMFNRYVRMQAHFAAEDGCPDLAEEILKTAVEEKRSE